MELYLHYSNVTSFEGYMKLTIATACTKTPWNILGIDKVPNLQFTMHKACDNLPNKKPAIYRVQQDNACFNVQHMVTEGFVFKEFGKNNPVSNRVTFQANESQTEKPSKNFGHYELMYELHLTLKSLHLPTHLIRVCRTANEHFCQQISRFSFCNRGDVCLL